jgi:hypothetical protein
LTKARTRLTQGGVHGVAEGAGQAGPTFMRRPRHGAVTQTEPHASIGTPRQSAASIVITV